MNPAGGLRHIPTYLIIMLVIGGCGLFAPDEDQTDDTPEDSYFPLHVGDTWWYECSVMGGPPTTRTFTITDRIRFDGKTYFCQIIDSLAPRYYRVDKTGNVYLYSESFPGEALYLDFHAPEGDSYTVPNTVVTVLHRSLTVETPAGSFPDCIEFSFDQPSAIGEEYQQAFAKGVGMVRHYSGMFMGSLELAGATIDNVEYPQ